MSLLDVQNLTIRFGGLTAVSNVNLQIDEGQVYSVIGPNGAGKTTVFNAITGIYEPTTGAIRFNGRRLKRPITWRLYLVCALIGVITALTAVAVSANIDNLWAPPSNAITISPRDNFMPPKLGTICGAI